MIRFSKRTQYAIKCLIHLHAYRDQGVITSQNISQLQQIPEKFLRSILSLLKKNDWVKSKQGPNGGYFLAEGTSQIRLREIIEELEVKTISESTASEGSTKESRISEKVILSGLEEIDSLITEHTSHLTLSELSSRYSKLLHNENQMYII